MGGHQVPVLLWISLFLYQVEILVLRTERSSVLCTFTAFQSSFRLLEHEFSAGLTFSSMSLVPLAIRW